MKSTFQWFPPAVIAVGIVITITPLVFSRFENLTNTVISLVALVVLGLLWFVLNAEARKPISRPLGTNRGLGGVVMQQLRQSSGDRRSHHTADPWGQTLIFQAATGLFVVGAVLILLKQLDMVILAPWAGLLSLFTGAVLIILVERRVRPVIASRATLARWNAILGVSIWLVIVGFVAQIVFFMLNASSLPSVDPIAGSVMGMGILGVLAHEFWGR